MAEVTALATSIEEAEQSKGDFGARIEELELRKVIGEISDDEFESMTAEGRDTVDSADQEITKLDEARQTIQGSLDRWTEMSGNSVIQDDDLPSSDPVVDAILPGFEDDGDSVEIESEDIVGFELDESIDQVDMVDDQEGVEASVEVEVDSSVDLEGDEEPIVDDEYADDVAILGDDVDVEGEAEEDAEDGEVGADIEEIGVDVSEEGSEEDHADDGPRRAILLSNEGTPDEQIYALTGEVFTVGRGRDNDLQIKNDSKVSRFHCKLYRRGSNYYLEDNKSSNGTMVNGELISERRLFGGEEVVIGETFFRFRVM